MIVVGRPAVQVSQIGGIFYPGDVGIIQVSTADSATGFPRIAAEAVTFTIASSDPAVGPNGDPRTSAVTKTFTLTVNDNIEFIQDGVPITTVTVAAGQPSSLQFDVRGQAAGTGTVTISASNYTAVTKSVAVAP